jgi:hypothetical protein
VFTSFHAELPLMTRILIGTSNFTVRYWPVMAAAAAGAFWGFRAWTRTAAGRLAWDKFKLSMPVAGKIVLKATMARFARSFALSSRSGVPIVQALTVVSQTVDNAYLCARVEQMRDGVERGDSILRTATAAGSVYAGRAADDRGGRGIRLDRRPDGRDRADVRARGRLRTEDLVGQIEPILITFLGVMVLVLALGIFLPIWDLGKAPPCTVTPAWLRCRLQGARWSRPPPPRTASGSLIRPNKPLVWYTKARISPSPRALYQATRKPTPDLPVLPVLPPQTIRSSLALLPRWRACRRQLPPTVFPSFPIASLARPRR